MLLAAALTVVLQVVRDPSGVTLVLEHHLMETLLETDSALDVSSEPWRVVSLYLGPVLPCTVISLTACTSGWLLSTRPAAQTSAIDAGTHSVVCVVRACFGLTCSVDRHQLTSQGLCAICLS